MTVKSIFIGVAVMVMGLLGSWLYYSDMSPAQATSSLNDVIMDAHRSPENKVRDRFRHPKETLEFFGLKDTMTVVELWPGSSGWYQEILAPYLRDHGLYYGAHFLRDGTSVPNMVSDRLAAHGALYNKVIVSSLAPPQRVDIAPAGSADMVLSFRNFHNWQMKGQEQTVLKAVYKALKAGGIFGITDHRSEKTSGKDGYVRPNDLILSAQAVGFVLVGQSDINANPKDTKNYDRGVWALLPTLAGKAEDQDKMRAIGESDRFTMKFMKPEESSKPKS